MTVGLEMIQPGMILAERYDILRLLGAGGMGAVYEAENTWTTRRVAIKVLHPLYAADSAAVERFKGEAQAATRLAHPNIVDVLDMGADPKSGVLYIVQEFLRGMDLHAFLEKRGVLEPSVAAEVIVPVMAALAIAHEQGIIHRDLKPENIFLVSNGAEVVPKIIDFGLSKVLGDGGPARKTVTGTIMGTPCYMSPEQAAGDRSVDARTDIWAMGVVLFEMLSGQLPFDAESANLIMFKILSTKEPPRLDVAAPGIPADVAAIVLRAMQPSLELRYATMRAMLEDILASTGFQAAAKKAPLRERFARSIEHRPSQHAPSAPRGSAETLPAGAADRPSPGAPARSPSSPTASAVAPRPVAADVTNPAEPRSTFDTWQRRRDRSFVAGPRSRRVGIAVVAVIAALGAAASRYALHRPPPSTRVFATPVVRVATPAGPVIAPRVSVPAAAPAPPIVADAGAPVIPARPVESPALRAHHHRHHSVMDTMAPAEPP